MPNQEIPIDILSTQFPEDNQLLTSPILEDEIAGIQVEHIAIPAQKSTIDLAVEGYKTIYLFISGSGNIQADGRQYELVPETIFLPNVVKKITISSGENVSLHYLRISCKLTAQDLLDLDEFPAANTQSIYFTSFEDCQSYSEPIKSPNTISRTILPNKIIPRVAMGTVQTTGPDTVAAHEHPMLEQLFLGLTNNLCTVYADEAKVEFPQYSVLHIPLGSRHSVSVAEGERLYYVWMDFFLDKKGEEWLKTHIEDVEI